jgi:glycogen operon protein
MSDDDWQQPHAKSFGVFLNGDALRERDDEGRPIHDDSFLLLFNAHHEDLAFTMPGEQFGNRWKVEIETAMNREQPARDLSAEETLDVPGRALMVLSRPSTRT